MLKVKSYEKDTGKVPQILQDGNNCADDHAGQAVIECPNGEANRIRNIDAMVSRTHDSSVAHAAQKRQAPERTATYR